MRWPHYEHIIFDCDSTLTTIEGIDVLAESVGKKWRVEVLTRAAMDGELDLEEIYAKRLRAVRPTRAQIRDIRRRYKQTIVEDAQALITTLQALGHQVYIISGGLAEPVAEFGVYLGVPRNHIRAVDVRYNELSGKWWQRQAQYAAGDEHYLTFDEGALTVSDGKAEIVQQLVGGKSGRSLLIGDGSSDLLASRAVDLFVGYGGVEKRERVLNEAPAFIHSPSLAPLLALAAGPATLARLSQSEQYGPLAKKSIHLIKTGAITFTDERLKQKFQQAFHSKISTAY
jgi:phosphoserine phosphatase